jgi:hypothetical protein
MEKLLANNLISMSSFMTELNLVGIAFRESNKRFDSLIKPNFSDTYVPFVKSEK